MQIEGLHIPILDVPHLLDKSDLAPRTHRHKCSYYNDVVFPLVLLLKAIKSAIVSQPKVQLSFPRQCLNYEATNPATRQKFPAHIREDACFATIPKARLSSAISAFCLFCNCGVGCSTYTTIVPLMAEKYVLLDGDAAHNSPAKSE